MFHHSQSITRGKHHGHFLSLVENLSGSGLFVPTMCGRSSITDKRAPPPVLL
ncbi:hypothetical protein HanIR_Chr13g0670041 [Helianthus annuus]|nr:hypothetical protein HanIR_Chr13g0670041 [Helianthus annuus]